MNFGIIHHEWKYTSLGENRPGHHSLWGQNMQDVRLLDKKKKKNVEIDIATQFIYFLFFAVPKVKLLTPIPEIPVNQCVKGSRVSN